MRVRESTYSVLVAILSFFFIALFVLSHGQVAAAHHDIVIYLGWPTVSQQFAHQLGEEGAHGPRLPNRLFHLQ